ncbi:hypothetical protein [Pararhodobacter zhoushanensis]|uniref:Uncharacterized protein n=1 Tax=Pararhodobacter zhoushanensis TaxID=2479545 RepID=A0ABT3GYN0_9RHOB|nr:hypothetical protein [Pararhodobacter zhoushanensis]MCW1932593.1 hypothetical protein [Pararhodobacter zhoushanensis]
MPLFVLLFRLLRRTARQPRGRLVLTFGITLVLIAVIWGIEAAGLWPDWAHVQGRGRYY